MKPITLLLILSFIFSAKAIARNTDQTIIDLNDRQRSIVAISAFTANGDLTNLKQALNDALTTGLTINEIKEELIHISAYCGFPRSLNGINTFSTVLTERKSKGITDKEGKAASKVAGSDKYQTGKKVLESLTGRPEASPKTGYAAFVPAIDTLLKEHLFNDIFTREVLTNKERELITIAALISLGGVESQLSGHFGICLYLGFTNKELGQVLSLIETKVGKKEADEGRRVLAKVTALKN
ncbi:carboxymuconolactone decarboxylase family protein [Dyadobacter sp. NIV53]|uniref:carboxymuconolactone decarboxylase family protein n=1 Tax=Dyadobacter sp. NIV53 TaxID=2861765 RepID=UPI001C871909|nr:carboxymuconolactone decarboxylase family protein [Dyadobacter sp. NIV53]